LNQAEAEELLTKMEAKELIKELRIEGQGGVFYEQLSKGI